MLKGKSIFKNTSLTRSGLPLGLQEISFLQSQNSQPIPDDIWRAILEARYLADWKLWALLSRATTPILVTEMMNIYADNIVYQTTLNNIRFSETLDCDWNKT